MLQSTYRLRHPSDVKRVRQEGRSWRHPLAILLVYPNALHTSRFAFIASRHVGKAVQRNRAKRLLREAVHKHLQEIEPGWDCVIIARPTLPQTPFGDVETAVIQLLQRAKMFTQNP